MNPIALALDFDTLEKADEMLSKVRDHIGMIKIGPELFHAYGREALELGPKYHVPIFLDLKLHDIPNTVAKTLDVLLSRYSEQYKIKFITVHAFGGNEMIKAAIGTAKGSDTEIAVVTLLTSIDSRDLGSFGFRDCREGIKTVDLALTAFKAGARSFVAAPTQIHLMRKHLDKPGQKVTLITPGIRATDSLPDDQKRTKPISFAIRNGSDWVVVGRPITQATDPDLAAKTLLAQALKARI